MCGEVWLPALDPTIGSEITNTRPCVVISPQGMNAHLRTILVAPMTTGSRRRGLSRSAHVQRDQGTKGLVLLDQIRTIDKTRMVKRLGKVTGKTQELLLCEAAHARFDRALLVARWNNDRERGQLFIGLAAYQRDLEPRCRVYRRASREGERDERRRTNECSEHHVGFDEADSGCGTPTASSARLKFPCTRLPPQLNAQPSRLTERELESEKYFSSSPFIHYQTC